MRAARMSRSRYFRPLLALPVFGLSVLAGASAPANAQPAQSSMGGIRPGGRPTMPTANLPTTGRRDVAPALPGAVSRDDTVAPADRPAMEMRPTEALFDSINRGDISAARDAIGRGAELNGRNILGFTPLELAVDLGRKDIVFLLLSQRGADDRPNRAPPNMQVRPGEAAAAFRRAQQEADEPVQRRPQQATRVAAQPSAQTGAQTGAQSGAQPTAQRVPQYTTDSGNPSPDSGFLGFGGGQGGRGRN